MSAGSNSEGLRKIRRKTLRASLISTVADDTSKERAWKRGLQALSLVLFFGVWELVGQRAGELRLMIAPASKTAQAWVELVTSGELVQALLRSNQAMVLGFSSAVLIGVPLGLLMGRFRTIEKLGDLYLDILLAAPMAALIPVIIVALGIGGVARITVVFLFCIVVITVNTRAGMKSVDPSLIEMARSFGANEIQIMRKILLPGALPGIMAGLRLGLGRAMSGMVVVELLLVAVGLGGMMVNYGARFKPQYVFATLITVIVEAVIIIGLAQSLQKRLAPWAEGMSAAG
jgi:ABC-type nitrate/sulfonate/bicarbonate transport system permease component